MAEPSNLRETWQAASHGQISHGTKMLTRRWSDLWYPYRFPSEKPMEQNTALPKEQLMSVLRTAPDRLEYLTPNDWILIIDKCRRVTLNKDEVLIKQGKREQTVYVLLDGRVSITVNGTQIAAIGPGEICGEMAYLENGLASATVTVEKEGQAYAID